MTRASAAIVTALAGATGLAWWLTLRPMSLMPGMAGMGTPLLPFLGMWAAMMTAMMLPAVAPVALLWNRAIGVQTPGLRGAWRLTQFVGGYLAAWTAAGLIAYLLVLLMESEAVALPALRRTVLAAALALAGLWQLTPIKTMCLRHCRSPLGFIAQHSASRGPLRDLRVGAHHGARCLGCCWALMAVLVVAGMMSLALMVGLTALVVAEKTLPGGPLLGRIAGWILLLCAPAAWLWGPV